MANGNPKTDRELLVQIDAKIGFMDEKLEQYRKDTVEIFTRLRTVELDAEKRRGVCTTHQAATQTLVEKIAAIPNVNKAIRVWGAIFVVLQAIFAIMMYTKG